MIAVHPRQADRAAAGPKKYLPADTGLLERFLGYDIHFVANLAAPAKGGLTGINFVAKKFSNGQNVDPDQFCCCDSRTIERNVVSNDRVETWASMVHNHHGCTVPRQAGVTRRAAEQILRQLKQEEADLLTTKPAWYEICCLPRTSRRRQRHVTQPHNHNLAPVSS
jgi:hypothetical protein